ncbi:uncharacterized protein BDZ99DRAFT_518562 [Mytilinidion resinicola]|uniref:Uncharacterized protein n=1 Tax=Mytilinidion resinicola TaxID=574789 RepID=A0A6A6YVD4_9PEZI|nr:uncharacterized protein BDZ99DRAFT_518562 [Mytilinidion resinicola]KAF2812751.1 hypothetical protein BDZ99DRAFT_518562 [Mytilinidion resinicola]
MAISGQRLVLLGPLCDQPPANRPSAATIDEPPATPDESILKHSTTTTTTTTTTRHSYARLELNTRAYCSSPKRAFSLGRHPHSRPIQRPSDPSSSSPVKTPTALADDLQPARTTTHQPSLS